MKKSFKILASGLVLSSVMLPGLVGNSVYCDKKLAEEKLYKASAQEIKNTEGVADLKETLKLTARSSILLDGKSGTIIYGDNIHEKLPMASMTKMMTMLLVMEEAEKGNINLNSLTRISEYSASQEGSECILEPNKEYPVIELIKSVAVASANDSAVALAELVSGSEEVFAKKMNKRAQELGMTNTHYVNATGLDAEGHYSTAHDLTKVIKALSKYDIISSMGKIWMYDMAHPGGRITSLTNTNRLVRTDANMLLAKTGHTDNAGYCITTLSRNGNQELIACVMGVKDSKTRFEEVSRLNSYGFANFETKLVLNSSEDAYCIKVKGGKEKAVKVYPAKDVYALKNKSEEIVVATELDIVDEISAPQTNGTIVGKIRVIANGKEELIDAVIKEDIQKITIKEITKKILES